MILSTATSTTDANAHFHFLNLSLMAHTKTDPNVPTFSKNDLARLYRRHFGDDPLEPERALMAVATMQPDYLSEDEISCINRVRVMMQELFDPIIERRVLEPTDK